MTAMPPGFWWDVDEAYAAKIAKSQNIPAFVTWAAENMDNDEIYQDDYNRALFWLNWTNEGMRYRDENRQECKEIDLYSDRREDCWNPSEPTRCNHV